MIEKVEIYSFHNSNAAIILHDVNIKIIKFYSMYRIRCLIFLTHHKYYRKEVVSRHLIIIKLYNSSLHCSATLECFRRVVAQLVVSDLEEFARCVRVVCAVVRPQVSRQPGQGLELVRPLLMRSGLLWWTKARWSRLLKAPFPHHLPSRIPCKWIGRMRDS